MRALGLLLLVGACANSYQSARVLQPGKTQVTVGLTRMQPNEGGGHLNVGGVQVRHGVGDKFDVGIRFERTAGPASALAGTAVDFKVQITEPGAKTAVSFALPIGLMWEEQWDDLQDGIFVASPTLFIGTEVSPTVDVVLSPKVVWLKPTGGGGDEDSLFQLGTGIGLRFFDESRSWAVHPELAVMRISDGNESATAFLFGLGLAVGN